MALVLYFDLRIKLDYVNIASGWKKVQNIISIFVCLLFMGSYWINLVTRKYVQTRIGKVLAIVIVLYANISVEPDVYNQF